MIITGDCIKSMCTVPAKSVQCCVTSPPYFGLRDYGHDGQIGLEQTPDEYVARLVDVFRGVRDVLADDGVLWLNLGDSYNAHPGQRKETDKAGAKQESLRGSTAAPSRCVLDLKPKDLIGIPWRVAFALQSDGWYLRQDIIWHKPNPMPESVKDRCTKAHEYVFLLTKSAKYYYDADAVKEPFVDERMGASGAKEGAPQEYAAHSTRMGGMDGGLQRFSGKDGRNRRSVWSISTKPFSGAHFAVMPEDLVEPCILAGSRIGDTILDPFFGSGTVGVVATRLGRKYIGCELNPEYVAIAKARLAGTQHRLPISA